MGKVGAYTTCSADSPKEQSRPEPVILEGGEGRLGEGVADQPEPPARDGDEEEGAVGILKERMRCCSVNPNGEKGQRFSTLRLSKLMRF